MAGLLTSEASVRVRDKRKEIADDLRGRGFRVEAGAHGSEQIMWARRGELVTAVLVTDQAPRSLAELALRISLGDWAEGHRDREFIFVRCLSQRPGPRLQRPLQMPLQRPLQMPAKRSWQRLLALAVKLAGGMLRVLRFSRLRPHH